MNVLASLEPKDWITIVAALLAAAAAIIAAIVTSATAGKTARDTITNLKERRYLDAIITQRMKWIDEIREAFIMFESISSKAQILIVTSYGEYNQKELSKMSFGYALELQEIINRIMLLSNPTEEWFNELYDKMIKQKLLFVSGRFENGFTEDEMALYNDLAVQIQFLELSILKSEWKRIQLETESGEKLKSDEMKSLFEKAAKSISRELYNDLFKK